MPSRAWILPLIAVMLRAQAPLQADRAFFQQDARTVLPLVLEQARNRKETDPQVWARYGGLLLASGDRAHAEEAFLTAMWHGFNSADAYRLIAHAWLTQGMVPEALGAFELMTQQEPTSSEYASAAVELMDSGFEIEALRLMAFAAKEDPTDYDAQIRFGASALRQGRSELAAAWFSKAAAAGGKEWECWTTLAEAHAPLGPKPAKPLRAETASRPLPGIWLLSGFPIRFPATPGTTNPTRKTFEAQYLDGAEVVGMAMRDLTTHLPKAKILPDTPSIEAFLSKGTQLPETDLILGFEELQVGVDPRRFFGTVGNYAAAFKLTLYTASGKRLRSLSFLETESTRGGRAIMGFGRRGFTSDRNFQEMLWSAEKQCLDFLDSAAFLAWTR